MSNEVFQDKSAIIIDVVRLRNFLKNNQLVQANGIVTKLENIVDAVLSAQSSLPDESDTFYLLSEALHKIKSNILCGRTNDALKNIMEIKL